MGSLKNKKGTINKPIGSDRHINGKYIVSKTGKDSVTHYNVLKEYQNYSYLSVLLETGRTHQIRVHMSHFGCPLVGDALYGSKINDDNIQGQCLHSRTIKFVHPINNKLMNFSTILPPYLDQLIFELFSL